MSDTTDDMEYLSGCLGDDNNDDTIYECPYCLSNNVEYDEIADRLICFDCKRYVS